MRTQVAGSLKAIHFREGHEVKAGRDLRMPEPRLAQLARLLGGITARGDPAKLLPVEAWNREQTVKLATAK